MQKKSVALVACSNGYGHIKRLLFLAESLFMAGANPTLFADRSSAELIAKKEQILIPKVINFDTHTNKENWLDSSAAEWVKFVPNLSKFDIVVSDNLVEILSIRPDAWLSGSFFWHDALNFFPHDLKKNSISLLKKYNPKMISSELFTSNQLKTYTKLYEVGLFGRANFLKKSNNKTDALIACGVGGSVKKEAFEFTKNLSNLKEIKYRKVWVEPDIIPLDRPDWMIPATFSPEMYQKILSAIIRPGVGTVTNSLSVGAKIFPFYESDNLEMQFNAKKIFLAGLASKTHSINDAWKASELFFESFDKDNFHEEKIAKINFNGAEEAALIMLNHI
jgi:hypothetical protein